MHSDIKGVGASAADEVEPPSFLLFLALLFFFLALPFIWLSCYTCAPCAKWTSVKLQYTVYDM